MPYLIDSTHVIYYFNDHEDTVELLDLPASEGIIVSIITYIEVFQGVEASADPTQTQAQFDTFFTIVPVLPITIEVAQRCARLRRYLKLHGRRVNSRALDLIIAATALEHDLTLVTNNGKDYEDIPGLQLYQP